MFLGKDYKSSVLAQQKKKEWVAWSMVMLSST